MKDNVDLVREAERRAHAVNREVDKHAELHPDGEHVHWCPDWDDALICEECPEYQACTCKNLW